MGRTGRVAGCYEGHSTRRYEPGKECESCGSPAAYRQRLCHDCLNETFLDYLPDPITIALECARIREGWDATRFQRSGLDQIPWGVPEVRYARQ